MPSPDDHFYDMRKLHVLFVLSALALLAVSVWMIVADSRREWKVFQRAYRDRVEPSLTEARLRKERSGEFARKEEELIAAVEEAAKDVPEAGLVDRFLAEVQRDADRRDAEPPAVVEVETSYQSLAAKPSPAALDRLVGKLEDVISAAGLRADSAERRLRFRRAELDEARSAYEAAYRQGLPKARVEALDRRVDAIEADLAGLQRAFDAADLHRQALESVRDEIAGPVKAARRALAAHRDKAERLARQLAREQPSQGKELARSPLVEAMGRPLRIEQIWLPDLGIDYHFRDVARFDRCVTCHLGVDRPSGSAQDEPDTLPPRQLTVTLAVPEEPNEPEDDADVQALRSLESLYGFTLAARGILDADAATVALVEPRSAGAMARLRPGDVILAVDGDPIASRAQALRGLTEGVEAGQTFELEIRRGLSPPHCSHPRPELFAGSESPHPMARFGCTICHQGQGSATEFKFASHTPNTLDQRQRWQGQFAWFWNQHWDRPMLPQRFAQSGCLKCHHDVTDLEPSERFPDPPAAKLVAGYQLIRQNGCFGCHEIKGVTAAGQRIGPDLRLEPNYHEAALELLADPGLNDDERRLARQVVGRPEEEGPRQELVRSIRGDDAPGRLSRDSMRVVEILAHQNGPPGTMRKVGPSLRNVGARLDAPFLEVWTRDPAVFRPGTRMPKFFGLHEHLEGEGLAEARRFEAVELRAIAEYLIAASQPVEPLPVPPEVTEPPSAERGEKLFQTQGCLACHRHADFPAAASTFAPELTNLGSKYTTEAGRRWLVSWIRSPSHHSPRTLMPNTLLEPVAVEGGREAELRADEEAGDEVVDEEGRKEGEGGEEDGGGKPVSDPAADIAAYLLTSDGWEPPSRPPLVEADVDALALLHLEKTLPASVAKKYLAEGIPESAAAGLDPDAAELVGQITLAGKLRYVGRRTIRKRGCFGCHDVPGFEDAQGIGPVLTDWGRKDPSMLAFEQIHQFMAATEPPPAAAKDPNKGFYLQALRAERREGFIWQKLRAPRSFDYKKVEHKGYNERLTMGRFDLTGDQREAIITFVLGLVADPPPSTYVYRPQGRRRAIVEGRKVLDRYGCAECHTLAMERWTFEYDDDWLDEWLSAPVALPDYDFVRPQFTPEELAASRARDLRGRGRAEVVGMPRVDASGEPVEDEDYDGNPLYFFTLWEPVAVDGEPWPVGSMDVPIAAPQITGKRPAWGGAFARLLFPTVLEEAMQSGSTATDQEAWGWVPPPLVHEGSKVRPDWLHAYLLDPYPIRPAAVLQMPKYKLSPDEAGKLVDFFAAVSGAEFPYSSPPQGMAFRAPTTAEGWDRLDRAMRLVTDRKTFCAKCHLIGESGPGGDVRWVLAPNFEDVSRRLRPEQVHRWLANPKKLLPYTGMPVNFPPEGPPMGQDLFEGTSREQLEAVADLLLHWDAYLKHHTPIRQLSAPQP